MKGVMKNSKGNDNSIKEKQPDKQNKTPQKAPASVPAKGINDKANEKPKNPKPKENPTDVPKIPFQKGQDKSGDAQTEDDDVPKNFFDEGVGVIPDDWDANSRKFKSLPKGRFYFPKLLEVSLQLLGFSWGKCLRFDDAFIFYTTFQLTMHFVDFALWLGLGGSPHELYSASSMEIYLEVFGFCKCAILYMYLNCHVERKPCSKLIIINLICSMILIGFQIYFVIENRGSTAWRFVHIIGRIIVYFYTNFTIWILGRQLLAVAQYNYSLSIQKNLIPTRLSVDELYSVSKFDTSDMSDYQFYRSMSMDHHNQADSTASKVTLRLVVLNPNT